MCNVVISVSIVTFKYWNILISYSRAKKTASNWAMHSFHLISFHFNSNQFNFTYAYWHKSIKFFDSKTFSIDWQNWSNFQRCDAVNLESWTVLKVFAKNDWLELRIMYSTIKCWKLFLITHTRVCMKFAIEMTSKRTKLFFYSAAKKTCCLMHARVIVSTNKQQYDCANCQNHTN